jgi:hypothetical protein
MESLKSIPGIDKSSLELLEAAGFLDLESIARTDADLLAAELERANLMLSIASAVPTRQAVAAWISTARDLTGFGYEAPSVPTVEVDDEEASHEAFILDDAPFAIPLPARLLMARALSVSDIPPAIPLNRSAENRDAKVGRKFPGSPQAKAAATASNYVRMSDGAGQRLEIDSTRLRSTSDAPLPLVRLSSSRTSSSRSRMEPVPPASSETDESNDLPSPADSSGVLDGQPRAMIVGALVTLLLLVATPLAVGASLLWFLSGAMPAVFDWVPGWLIVFPVSLPVFGLCYMIWGFGKSCQICGESLFRYRRHPKNPAAHHLKCLGYILPLCFQVLLFRWFRCTYCGASVSLKE